SSWSPPASRSRTRCPPFARFAARGPPPAPEPTTMNSHPCTRSICSAIVRSFRPSEGLQVLDERFFLLVRQPSSVVVALVLDEIGALVVRHQVGNEARQDRLSFLPFQPAQLDLEQVVLDLAEEVRQTQHLLGV